MQNDKQLGFHLKKKKKEKCNIADKKILSKEEILSSIPNNSFDSEQKDLQNVKTEYRWRIMNIENIDNEIIEISIKKTNENRLYLNQSGEWIEYDSQNYDKYVTKSYYYYE
jgi:hypothetical protein